MRNAKVKQFLGGNLFASKKQNLLNTAKVAQKLSKCGRTNRQTNQQTNRQTDKQTDLMDPQRGGGGLLAHARRRLNIQSTNVAAQAFYT